VDAVKTKKTLVTLPTVLAIVLMIGSGCGSAKKTTKGLDASSTPGDNASRDDRGAVPDKPEDTSSFTIKPSAGHAALRKGGAAGALPLIAAERRLRMQ
jgi:hypothetical protein